MMLTDRQRSISDFIQNEQREKVSREPREIQKHSASASQTSVMQYIAVLERKASRSTRPQRPARDPARAESQDHRRSDLRTDPAGWATLTEQTVEDMFLRYNRSANVSKRQNVCLARARRFHESMPTFSDGDIVILEDRKDVQSGTSWRR